ncbi:hypothetical protein EON62_03995, partial [archaeon]
MHVPACRLVAASPLLQQNPLYEFIFWGTVTALLLINLFICCIPCCRNRVILCSKRWCGVLLLPTLYEDEVTTKNGREKHHLRIVRGTETRTAPPVRTGKNAHRLPPNCSTRTLLSVNIFTLIVGLAALAVISYAIYYSRFTDMAVPLFVVCVFTIAASSIGIVASRKRADRGPSCWLLAYFYIVNVVLVLMIWATIYVLVYSNWRNLVEAHWGDLREIIPAQYMTGTTEAQQIDSLVAVIKANLYAIAIVAVGLMVIFLGALISAARLVHAHTIASMLLAFADNIMLLLGVLLTVVGFYLYANSGRVAGIVRIIGVTIGIGVSALLFGSLGLVAQFKKIKWLLIVHMIALLALASLSAVGVWLFFTEGDRVASYMDAFTDDQISSISSALGMSMSKAELERTLQDNLRKLGLAAAVSCAICTLLFLCAIVYYRALSYVPPAPKAANEAPKSPTPAPVMRAPKGSMVPTIDEIDRAAGADEEMTP